MSGSKNEILQVSFSFIRFWFPFAKLLQYVPMSVNVVYHDENMDIECNDEAMEVDVVEDESYGRRRRSNER
jgi:hypothetical protein